MPFNKRQYFDFLLLLLFSEMTVNHAENTIESRLGKKLVGSDLDSRSKNKLRSSEDFEDALLSNMTNPNISASMDNTKLKFHEMVSIYHDIWNTMLMGQAQARESIFQQKSGIAQ